MKRQNLKKTSGCILFDKSIYEKNNPYKRFNIHNARAKVKLIKNMRIWVMQQNSLKKSRNQPVLGIGIR